MDSTSVIHSGDNLQIESEIFLRSRSELHAHLAAFLSVEFDQKGKENL
jgi:hypothetical protein